MRLTIRDTKAQVGEYVSAGRAAGCGVLRSSCGLVLVLVVLLLLLLVLVPAFPLMGDHAASRYPSRNRIDLSRVVSSVSCHVLSCRSSRSA